MRLIDADALKGHFLNGGEDYYSGYAFHHAIDHIPTVDAVPVVRCRECKYRYVDGDNVRFNLCLLNHNKVQSDDWYCADGERKGGDE